MHLLILSIFQTVKVSRYGAATITAFYIHLGGGVLCLHVLDCRSL